MMRLTMVCGLLCHVKREIESNHLGIGLWAEKPDVAGEEKGPQQGV